MKLFDRLLKRIIWSFNKPYDICVWEENSGNTIKWYGLCLKLKEDNSKLHGVECSPSSCFNTGLIEHFDTWAFEHLTWDGKLKEATK